jgi:rRNA maturation endonuclease Nob1
LTDVVYTVEDVVKEIRDTKTRESLTVVLYTLKFKEPSTDAIRFGKILLITYFEQVHILLVY